MFASNSSNQLGAAAGYCNGIGQQAAPTGDYAKAARDVSPLEQAMNGASNAIHELASCVDMLEGRLSPVMRPVPPQPATAGGLQGVDVAHSMAVDQVNVQRRQIENLIRRVHEIADRLET